MRRSVVVDQLELVLEPCEPLVRQVQNPAAVVAYEVGLAEWQVRAEPNGCVARLGIFNAETSDHRATVALTRIGGAAYDLRVPLCATLA